MNNNENECENVKFQNNDNNIDVEKNKNNVEIQSDFCVIYRNTIKIIKRL